MSDPFTFSPGFLARTSSFLTPQPHGGSFDGHDEYLFPNIPYWQGHSDGTNYLAPSGYMSPRVSSTMSPAPDTLHEAHSHDQSLAVSQPLYDSGHTGFVNPRDLQGPSPPLLRTNSFSRDNIAPNYLLHNVLPQFQYSDELVPRGALQGESPPLHAGYGLDSSWPVLPYPSHPSHSFNGSVFPVLKQQQSSPSHEQYDRRASHASPPPPPPPSNVNQLPRRKENRKKTGKHALAPAKKGRTTIGQPLEHVVGFIQFVGDSRCDHCKEPENNMRCVAPLYHTAKYVRCRNCPVDGCHFQGEQRSTDFLPYVVIKISEIPTEKVESLTIERCTHCKTANVELSECVSALVDQDGISGCSNCQNSNVKCSNLDVPPLVIRQADPFTLAIWTKSSQQTAHDGHPSKTWVLEPVMAKKPTRSLFAEPKPKGKHVLGPQGGGVRKQRAGNSKRNLNVNPDALETFELGQMRRVRVTTSDLNNHSYRQDSVKAARMGRNALNW